MSKKDIWVCTKCLSSCEENKKAPKCLNCGSIMLNKEAIIEDWVQEYSPQFAKLFNGIAAFYKYTHLVTDDYAEYTAPDEEMKDEYFEIINNFTDMQEKWLKLAIVLHTTGEYMQLFNWEDFEFNPPIDLMDKNIRAGFLFFLDALCLALTHAILRTSKKPNTKATLEQCVIAHNYFNHHLRTQVGGVEEMKEAKARWPVLIYTLLDSYIPPLNGISSVWRDAESFSK